MGDVDRRISDDAGNPEAAEVGDAACATLQAGGYGMSAFMGNGRKQCVSWIERLSVVASALLLVGASLDGRHFRPPPDASEYLNRVKAASEVLPPQMGNWMGVAADVPQSAIRLLHPNVMISRSYKNLVTGAVAGFLFVDCQDARDTVGHYPPICYPAAGWSLQVTDPRDWNLPHMVVHGTEYTFAKGDFDGNGNEIVDNFFVLPGVGTMPNRDEVIKAAGDLQRRFYGVAQIQLVFDGDVPEAQREQTFQELIGPLEGLMHTVQTIRPDSAAQVPTAAALGKGELQ
jgi:hypothetical protein